MPGVVSPVTHRGGPSFPTECTLPPAGVRTSGQCSMCSAGHFHCPRGNVPVPSRALHNRPPALAASEIHFKPHFGPKPRSLFPGRKNEASQYQFFFFFFYCLFKEQSYKIKISSSGKENLIQTFLRTDSTTFPHKQNKKQTCFILGIPWLHKERKK